MVKNASWPRHVSSRVLLLACVGVIVQSAAGHAQSYTRLQVLLPGEMPAPGTITGKIGVPEDQTSGVPFTVRMRACDSQWATVTSVTDVIALGSSDASASLPSPAALIAGELAFQLTINAGGSFVVTASDETDPSIPDATSAPFTALVLQGFEFERISQKNQYAGVPMGISLSAVDPTGNVVTGFSGPVRLRELTSYGEGRIEPDEVILSHGTWSGSVINYRADETSINRGNVNIEAYLGSNPARNGLSDPFVVHPGSFSRVQIVAPGQSPLPGSLSGLSGSPATQAAGEAFNVQAYATDPYWNPVPSADVVRITSSDPAAGFPVSGSLTGGFREFTVSLATVGGQTLTISDQSNGSIQGMTTTTIQVIPAGAHHFEFDPIASPATAGDAVPVTIRATDASGNTIPSYDGNAILSANTGPGSISPEAIVFADGVWSGAITFRGAGGAVSVTCSDFSAPPHTGTAASIEVLPGAYTGLQVLLPGQTAQGGTASGFSGAPDDQSAGTAFSIRIRAVDPYWNRVPGVTNRVNIASSDPFIEAPVEPTLVNGELLVPVTLFRAEGQTITVSDLDQAGIADHTSSRVTVIPGSYSRIVIVAPGQEVAPGSEEGRTGDAIDQSINFAFNVDVHATDAWWNPVAGVSDVVRLGSTDPLAQIPGDTVLQDGHATLSIRLATGGYQQITAANVSQPAMPPSTVQVRAISSGFHLEAEVTPLEVQAGEPFTLTVRVVNDAGAIISEINSFVTISVQNASSGEPGRGALLTQEFQLLQGQRSVTETYTFAEPIVLVARDDAGNAPAITDVITIDPGTPAAIRLASDPQWVRANRHATITARLVDTFENGVPGQPMDLVVALGTGTLTSIDNETGPDGMATADFLSPRQAELGRIRATSGELSASLDIETALVDPDLPGGSVTSYPNPFHPGEVPATIAYKLADNAGVSLRIYTLSGGLVLAEDFRSGAPGARSGLNEFVWDGRNGDGRVVASGAYLVHIEAKGAGETLHVMRHRVGVVR